MSVSFVELPYRPETPIDALATRASGYPGGPLDYVLRVAGDGRDSLAARAAMNAATFIEPSRGCLDDVRLPERMAFVAGTIVGLQAARDTGNVPHLDNDSGPYVPPALVEATSDESLGITGTRALINKAYVALRKQPQDQRHILEGVAAEALGEERKTRSAKTAFCLGFSAVAY